MYLIPTPQKMEIMDEICYLPYYGKILIDSGCSDKIYGMAHILQEDLKDNTGFIYEITKGKEKGPIFLKQNRELKEEQYQLIIKEDTILITGGDERGILYGIQTFRQILSQKGGELPCLRIDDYPDIPVRGFYHDVTRGRVPTLVWLKKLADTLSYYKINQLQLYVEHSFLFDKLSEVWRDDTPLTAGEIIELDHYCMQRGIELVPSLSTFGHLYKLLSTKQYRHLSECTDAGGSPFSFVDRMAHHTIDVSSEEGFELIKGLLLEYMPLFTSKKFNIGADETFDLGKGRNKKRAKEEGIPALYMEYVGKLCAFVTDQGYTPLLWGDVMLEFPELAHKLPKGTICLNWGYAPMQTENSTRIYAEHGVTQYVCPGVAGWNQLLNLIEGSYSNISRMCRYALKYKAAGVLNTDWGDYGHINHPEFSIPGIIYGAAASWKNSEFQDYKEINREISVVEYRDTSENLMDILGRLSQQESFGWTDAVQWKEKYHMKSEEEQKKFWLREEEKRGSAEEKNRNIDSCIRDLTCCISAMDTNSRARIKSYLAAAEGMRIFNELGDVLLQSAKKEKVRDRAVWTSEKLEKWYYRYKLLWYSVSKESELYRIGEVIFWYADYLRDLQ